jgi:hypothetical protein
VSIAAAVLNVGSIFYPNARTFMWGFPAQVNFFPMGLKSDQGLYLLNMRMARPARDSTFMCLNPGSSGQSDFGELSIESSASYINESYLCLTVKWTNTTFPRF